MSAKEIYCMGRAEYLAEYKGYSDLFDSDLYEEISLATCVKKRISEGGTSPESVEKQLQFVKGRI